MPSARSALWFSAPVACGLLAGVLSVQQAAPPTGVTVATPAVTSVLRDFAGAATPSDVTRRADASVTRVVPRRIPQTHTPNAPAVTHRAESFGAIAPGPAEVPGNPPAPDAAAAPDRGERAGDGDVPRIMFCHPDPLNAADALQACIDRAPAFSSVEIPPGVYMLHRQIVVSTPLTIRTAGTADTPLSCAAEPGRCAILMAGPHLMDPWGLLFIRSTNNVLLEHLVIDGNRGARLSSGAARSCQAGRTSPGFNASALGCLRCELDDVVSRNALCGTGMVWSGAQASIRRSEFSANGDSTTPHMWADGLTVVYAPESEIRQNRFVDNSDIGLIVGYGVRSRVEQNVVLQYTQTAFAGLMLDNFNSDNLSFRGDFRGAVIANNVVDCAQQMCVFGIQVGPGPWYPSQNIVGGELHSNEVRGAKVGINVDGAGDPRAPTAIFANKVFDVPPGAWFSQCTRRIATGWMNVSPTSVVDRRNELAPTGAHLSDACQLWSDVARADQ